LNIVALHVRLFLFAALNATILTRKILVNSSCLFLFSTAPVVNTLLLYWGESDRDMTGSTKILTVSYGTFSCTLEGFDDPFGTMRGIAEYFRDLAAEDRYFGAEPPTPDVEMLQRIAEKEVQRRVEARLGDNGIALTQLAGAQPSAPAAEAAPAARNESPDDHKVVTPDPDEVDLDHGPLTHEDEYLLSDEPEDVLAVDPDSRPVAQRPAESVAEKLRRIRAVVSRPIEPEAEQKNRSFSDEQARFASDPEDAPKRDRALSETIRQITSDLSDDEDAPMAASIAPAEEEIEEFSSEIDDADEAMADEAMADEAMADEAMSDEAMVDEAITDEMPFEVHADTTDEEDEDEDWTFDLKPTREKAKSAPAPEPVEETISRIMSASGARGTAAPGDPLRPDPSKSMDGDEPAPNEAPRVSKPLSPISDTGDDVGRLMAETDNHLNDGEGIRRRRVISQMRAAVAATRADRMVSRRVTSPDEEVEAEQERYRDDLSEAVREVSRPLSKDVSARKASVAPLILVSSQRVNDPAPTTRTPPRQAPQGFATDLGGFAGFAKSMGAKELPDLLEAAAAYAAFVEGQPSFSRPEIMKRVARMDPSLKLSREDGLRSFGQLLRQGKFRKLERGQFVIDDKTRFKPDQRIAGE
jgi:hypothetical protein